MGTFSFLETSEHIMRIEFCLWIEILLFYSQQNLKFVVIIGPIFLSLDLVWHYLTIASVSVVYEVKITDFNLSCVSHQKSYEVDQLLHFI